MDVEITFDARGNASCLYHEAIPLHKLGRLSVRRASHIEFDSERQLWHVLAADKSQVLFSHCSREACLRWERFHLTPEGR